MTYEAEQKRLSEVFKMIESELWDISGSIDFSNNEIKRQNKDMWEGASGAAGFYDMSRLISAKAFLDDLAQSNRALEFKKKRYDILIRMLESAYFGRVDFVYENSGVKSRIYIGIGSLGKDDTGELVIYDWRAPISSLFYDADIGKTGYMSPEGLVNGEMTKRLQLKIQFDRIIHMIDSNIKIDDDILIQILSQYSDSKMKTIVSTIQKEQNRIIRDDRNDVMIAVGPAGSGKTSVAMHRIAYLLYKERETLSSRDILILTPNNIFADYVSTVLPKLGEENVSETTVSELVSELLKDFYLQSYKEYMEATLIGSDPDRTRSIKIKTSKGFAGELDAYAEKLKEKLSAFSDVTYGNKVIISGSELSDMYENELQRFSPHQRMQKIGTRVSNIVKQYKLNEFRARYKQLTEDDEFRTTAEAAKLAKSHVDTVFSDIDKETAGIAKTDWSRYYLEFIRSRYDAVYDVTKSQFEKNYLLYEDIIPYTYFISEMGAGIKAKNIRHVIIDELQDYPYIAVKFFSRLFRDSKITMLGDGNQTVCKGIDGYDPISDAELFDKRRMSVVILTKSYRSSYEIYEFCGRILKDDLYKSSAVMRHEKEPEILHLAREA